MSCNNYQKIDIERSIRAALSRLYKRDADLLRIDVNERTITHKLAEYLEPQFPCWNVDCEYNRHGHSVKRLKTLWGNDVPIDDTDGISVFPDIIVHKRMKPNENLLVIEVKKSTNRTNAAFDKQKLRAYKDEIGYQHALFLLIEIGSTGPDAQLEWV